MTRERSGETVWSIAYVLDGDEEVQETSAYGDDEEDALNDAHHSLVWHGKPYRVISCERL